jgi:uncharacterized lipoprotein YehR (DUF1307 family)
MTKRFLTVASLSISLLALNSLTGCDKGGDAKSETNKPESKTAESKFTKGQKVEANWNGTWYKAEIVEVNGSKYKVHYTGWGAKWDQELEESKVREPKGIKYAYAQGDLVEVQWKDKWYESKVLEVQGEDMFKVHYEGWDDKWDEVVDGNRIRPKKGG